jgi:outer membrane protein assembly factor BamB
MRRVVRSGFLALVTGAIGLAMAGQASAAVVGSSPVATYQANGRVQVITVSGGTVYIGGAFTSVRPAGASAASVTRNHLAAFDEATGALLPWNPNASGNVRAIEVVGSTVYVGGSFTRVGGASRHDLAAVDATTAAVQPWNPGAGGQVLDMGAANGTLYVGGDFTTAGGAARTRLAAFSTVTGALTSWAPSADAEVKALSLTADDAKVVIGGDFTHVNGSSQSHIAALDPTTGAPLSWATHLSYSVIDLDVDASGVYVAGGGGGGNFAALDPATGAKLWDGGTDGNVQAVGVVGGVVYFGGHYGNYCGPGSGAHTCSHPTSRKKLLAVDETTGSLLSWNPGANSSLGIFALAGDPATDALFAGGDFTTIGGRSQQRFAEFRP